MKTIQASVLILNQPKSLTMGSSRNWQDTGRKVNGNFDNVNSRDAETWKQQGLIVSHIWFFASDPQVLELINAFSFNGERYEIRNVENIHNLNRRWEVVTEKIRAQPA